MTAVQEGAAPPVQTWEPVLSVEAAVKAMTS